jgi:hypothetical protein
MPPPTVMTVTASMIRTVLRNQCRFFFRAGLGMPAPPGPVPAGPAGPPGPPGRTTARPLTGPAGPGDTGTVARPLDRPPRDQLYRGRGSPSGATAGSDTAGPGVGGDTRARPAVPTEAVARAAPRTGSRGAPYESCG